MCIDSSPLSSVLLPTIPSRAYYNFRTVDDDWEKIMLCRNFADDVSLAYLFFILKQDFFQALTCLLHQKNLFVVRHNADECNVPYTEKWPPQPSSSSWVCGPQLPAGHCPGRWRPTTSAAERTSGQSSGPLDPRPMCSGGLVVPFHTFVIFVTYVHTLAVVPCFPLQ